MFRVANPFMGWGYGPYPSDDDGPLYPYQDFSSPDAPNTRRGSIPVEDLLFQAPHVHTQPVYRVGRNPRAGFTRHPAYSHPRLAHPAFLPPDPAYLRQDQPPYDLTLLPNPPPSHPRPRVIGRAPVLHPPYDVLYDDDDDDDDADSSHEPFLAAAVPTRRLEPAASKYRGGAAASPPSSRAVSSTSQDRQCPPTTAATPAANAATHTPSAISNDEYDEHFEHEHVPGQYEAKTGHHPRRHHQATSSTDLPRQRQQGPQQSEQHSRGAQHVSSRPVWFFDPSSGLCFLATAPSARQPPTGSGGRTNIPTTTTTTPSQLRGKLRQGQPGACDPDTIQQQQQPPATRTAEVTHPAADRPRPASPEASRAACASAGAGAANRPTRIRVHAVDSSSADNLTSADTPAAPTTVPVTYRPGSKTAPSSSSSSGATAGSKTAGINRSRPDTHPFLERQDSTAIVTRPSMEVALSRGSSAVLPSAAEAGVADAVTVPVTSMESMAGAVSRSGIRGGCGGAGRGPFAAAAANAATAAAAASTTSMIGSNGSRWGAQSRAGGTMTKSQAARTIQRWWRGWRLWRHGTALRQLVAVAGQLRAAAGSFYAYMGATAANITSRQQLEINELAMRVILKLDSMEGLPPEFRALRKHLTARALRLQDEVAAAYTASAARPAASRANTTTVEALSAASSSAVPAAAAVDAVEATVADDEAAEAEAAEAEASPSAVIQHADRAGATNGDGDAVAAAVPITAHVQSSPSDDDSFVHCSSEPPSPVLSPLSSLSPPPSPAGSSSQHEVSEVEAASAGVDEAAMPDGSPSYSEPSRDADVAEDSSAAVTTAGKRLGSNSKKDFVAADSTSSSALSPCSSACPIPSEAPAPTSPTRGVEGRGRQKRRRPGACGVYVGGGGFGGYLRKRPSAGEIRRLRRCGVVRTASPSAATAAAMTKKGRTVDADEEVGLCGDGEVAVDERQMRVGAQPTVVVRLVVAEDGVERSRGEGLPRILADVGVQTE